MHNSRQGAFLIRRSGGWWNQALLKDVGIVPYILHKNYGFRAVLVGSGSRSVLVGGGKLSRDRFPYLDKYVRGLEMDFIPENTLQARLEYINAHADEMDLMIVHGAHSEYIPIVEHYRRVRPDGKIYLATDMNIGWASKLPHMNPDYEKFIKSCDVIAASCRETQKYISVRWRVPVDLIRNGWYNFPQVSFDNLFEQKENIILTVGRISNLLKRNQDLLEAFAKVSSKLPDWSVRFVGKISDEFKPYIENFFAIYPNLRERVIFTGLIEDKAALMNEYKRAKIFCLTSTREGGTPNVVAEALFAGDFMVCSSFDAAYEATDYDKCGRVFPIGNVSALANIFLEICHDTNLLLKGGQHSVEYARMNFDSEHIVAKLHYLLYGGDKQ